ncbi:UvrD-helicase domain-containing protein [Propionibacteriaceae bacterium G1746]
MPFTMAAGDSAAAEAQRQLALARAHEQAAVEAKATAARYGIAEETEKRTARTLAPLAGIGFHLLADRAWPGTRRAQVDLVVIGQSGVFIVDTKAWAEVTINQGRIFRGEADVTDDLLSLASLLDTTQADLVNIGLAPGEVHALIVLAGRSGIDATVHGVRIVGERDALRTITSYGNRLTQTQIDAVLARSLSLFSQVSGPAPVVATVPEPVVPAPPATVELDGEPSDLVHTDVPDDPATVAALLAAVMAQPVEEWMSFLHPDQAKLVRRSFAGPSRVRGPAGSGKTVVGLHRAAHLARTRPGRVLVTTYVRTLPDVLSHLLRRLAPDVVDRVDFVGVHAFASRLLRDRGVQFRLEPKASDAAFDTAWQTVGRAQLGELGQTPRYWSDEIQHVLKGRGITRFEQYADLARTGRRLRLPVGSRRGVWALFEAYQAELNRRRINDYADIILLAEQHLRDHPMADAYSSVIVDEAQDLSCAMVRMLHQLVGDEPDGLTLIGDGQQSIYPGGYALGEAGISVAGRGVVLDINYRNTKQILSFAQRLVDGDEYTDIEGVVSRGDVPSSVLRDGAPPAISRCRDTSELERHLVERIGSVTREVGTSVGDVAVLCQTKRAVDGVTRALERAGIPVIQLEKYRGETVDRVKVGTIKRAKGLEFKQVLIPDIHPGQTSMSLPVADGDHERWELERRELYVAMTRARDGLWVGITG